MGGIVGIIDKTTQPEKNRPLLAQMARRIRHRGVPSAVPYHDGAVSLQQCGDAFKNTAADPLYFETPRLAAVYDGTIVNFKELRQKLSEKGYTFAGESDGELLAAGYKVFGEQLPQLLRGAFAFVIWDKEKQTLFLARDPFGAKPLFYYKLPQGLLFASEIKCFLEHPGFNKKLNPHLLRAYLSFQYSPGSSTFFQGVHELPPAHYAVWSARGLSIKSYFELAFNADESGSFESWAERIDAAVHRSVDVYKQAEKPVGSFLSGGVDSSYITACLMPQQSFSIGFQNDNFDESGHAKELSDKLGIENVRRHLTAQNCFDALSSIQYHMDEPQSNPSSVPLWFLAEMASEEVPVVLSGEGADELFAGYELYGDTPTMEKYKRLPLWMRRFFGALGGALPEGVKGRNFLLKSSERSERWFIGQADVFGEKQAAAILKSPYKQGLSALQMTQPYYEKANAAGYNEVVQKQYLDYHLWMPGDILVKADRMCMAHSLDVRMPLLDQEILKLAVQVPTRYNLQGTHNKMVFRHAANKTLPDAWANRPKKGFPVPIRHWLAEKPYYERVKEYFTSRCATEFFDTKKLNQLADEHYGGKANNARQIWTAFTFLVWYERFFMNE